MGITELPCDICGELCIGQRGLVNHHFQAHPNDDEMASASEDEELPYKCAKW